MGIEYTTQIEQEIKSVLVDIQENISPLGYQYFSKTNSVDIEDVALERAIGRGGVNYMINQSDGEDALSTEYGFDSMENSVDYTINARVSSLGSEGFPKQACKLAMNEVLSDLKHAFFINPTLNGIVFRAKYSGAKRRYTKSDNRIMTGVLEFKLNVHYAQRGNDPTAFACEH